MTREEYITQIQTIRRELFTLGVTPERFEAKNLSDEEIKEEFEAFSEQIKTRKRFLERAGNGKKLNRR